MPFPYFQNSDYILEPQQVKSNHFLVQADFLMI